MNEIIVNRQLSIDLENESIKLDNQEIGYITLLNYENKMNIYIFIEEEYRFHHYALDSLKALVKYFLSQNNVDRVEFFIEKDNRAGLDLIGHLNVCYVCYNEESEEHIFTINREQFFKQQKEKKEIFDTYDVNLNNLNFDFERGRKYPEGLYHIVVNVLLIDKDKKVLVTLRNPNKSHPLCYEITTGSVLKGETPREGAIRELYEEVGIKVKENELIEFGRLTIGDCHIISFVCFLNIDEHNIQLQDDEVIDYAILSFDEFASLVESKHFLPSNRKVINHSKKKLNSIIENHFKE